MDSDSPIEVELDEVVIDGPSTIHLRTTVRSPDVDCTVSTVWFRDEPVRLETTSFERGDDPELAGACERAALVHLRTDDQFDAVTVERSPDFEYPRPDAEVVFVGGEKGRHEV